jgi:hypothetical protein
MPAAALLPLPRSNFFDANGNPLSGGLVYTQVPGGGPPKTTWQDENETTPNSYPIVLDANGSAAIYGVGSYFYVVTDALGNQIPSYGGPTQNTLSNTFTNVSDFGAAGNGVTDDSASLQAAIDFVISTGGGILVLNADTYLITIPLVVHGLITIMGNGKTASVIKLGTNNLTAFNVTTNAPVTFTSFSINGGTVTGGTGVLVNPTSGINSESIFRDLQLISLDECIDTENAQSLNIDNVTCLLFQTFGIRIRNIINPDAGDSVITNCYIQASGVNGVGIEMLGSGGLKVDTCKMLSGLYGFAMFLDGTAATGDLLITGCSLEGQSGASIHLAQAAPNGTYHSVEITGCQFNGTPQAVSVLNSFGQAGWITDLSISGGSMWITAAGIGILLDGLVGFSISGVVFHSLGGGVTCVSVSNTCEDGLIAPLAYFGPGITTYVSNLSPSTIVQPRIQRGTSTQTTSVGYGALFVSAGATVNFPGSPQFLTVPKIMATPNTGGAGANGAVSVVISAVTTSGFNAAVVAVANATAVGFDWTAYGD